MARSHKTQSRTWSFSWPDSGGQSIQQASFDGLYNYLLLLTGMLSLILFGNGPLPTPDTIEFYQSTFLTKLGNMYSSAYAYSTPLTALGAKAHFSLEWLEPWPNYTTGRLSWYRQGLHEVEKDRTLIEALDRNDVPGIILAAAIANQGNSYCRPFGTDVIEKGQRWLGEHFDWPLPQWQWAKTRWNADFKEYSIGIGQITPGEVDTFGYDHRKVDLFDPATSIKFMQIKLAKSGEAAAALNLNKTDWFILMAIGNNDGLGVLNSYVKYGRDMQNFLANDARSRVQLAKMMSYIDYLHTVKGWELPEGVNRDHIWWLIRRAKVGP